MGAGREIKSVPEELVQFIKSGSRFIIAGHKEPDGDCAGSQLALRSALVRLGKEVLVCSAGPFKRTELRHLSGQFITEPAEEEKINAKLIIVDCGSRERTGDLEKFLDGLPCAIIDHHEAGKHLPSSPENPVYLDADAPSCTLLIDKLIAALGLELTEEEAQLLFFGLCTDTGFFRHLDEKNGEVFTAAAKMVDNGANPKDTFHIMNGGKSLKSRVLLGHLLLQTESHFHGKLLLTYETHDEFKTFGFEARDSESLNKLLQSIEGVQANVIIRQELADDCTVSLRSTDEIDVAQIAASLGGGGHRNAAGFTMRGNISNIKQIMLEAFSKVFQ